MKYSYAKCRIKDAINGFDASEGDVSCCLKFANRDTPSFIYLFIENNLV